MVLLLALSEHNKPGWKTLMCGFFTAIQSKQILRIRNQFIRYKISVDQCYLESQLGVVVELIAVCDCARSLITGNGISEIWNKKNIERKNEHESQIHTWSFEIPIAKSVYVLAAKSWRVWLLKNKCFVCEKDLFWFEQNCYVLIQLSIVEIA